jgi:hypothetical protein
VVILKKKTTGKERIIGNKGRVSFKVIRKMKCKL